MRQNWQMWESVLSPEECDLLIEDLKQLPVIEGQTFNSSGNLETNTYRQSNIRWVDNPDIRAMLWWYAQEANRNAFGFDVTSVGSIQFTEYSEEYKGKYNWHHDIDWNDNTAFQRKISVVLQLSDGDYYEGADFEFGEVPNPDSTALRKKGTIICFPSYLQHRVTEITKGTRYSLVAWFEGKKWQ